MVNGLCLYVVYMENLYGICENMDGCGCSKSNEIGINVVYVN